MKLTINLPKDCEEITLLFNREVTSEEGNDYFPTNSSARNIMGKNFFGAKEIEEAFGLKVDEPSVPYSNDDLKAAVKLGEMLVLRSGSEMTMQRVNELVTPTLARKSLGKAIWDTDWYKNEDFFTKETPRTGWKLVSKGILPETKNQDYFSQIKMLRDKFDHIVPSDAVLKSLQDKSWVEAAKELAQHPFNRLHRRTAVEAFYDTMLVLGSSGERLLENTYDWTCSLASVGNLVSFGYAGAGGALVCWWRPDDAGGDVGVCSSR